MISLSLALAGIITSISSLSKLNLDTDARKNFRFLILVTARHLAAVVGLVTIVISGINCSACAVIS